MPTPTEQRREHYDTFVTEVKGLCHDNGIRAALATGRGRPVEQCRKLHRFLTVPVAGHGAKRAHYTVASLIALQRPESAPDDLPPEPVPPDQPPPPAALAAASTAGAPQPVSWRARPNLGTSLAWGILRSGFQPGPTEQRLHTLIRLDADLLQPFLPSVVTRLLRVGITPDFAVLLEDLAWWDHDRDKITTRWLESFHLTTASIHLPQEL